MLVKHTAKKKNYIFWILKCWQWKTNTHTHTYTHIYVSLAAREAAAKASPVASSRPVCVPVLLNERSLAAERNSLSWQRRSVSFLSYPCHHICTISLFSPPSLCTSSSFLPFPPLFSLSVVIPPSPPVYSFHSLFICPYKPNLFSPPDAS